MAASPETTERPAAAGRRLVIVESPAKAKKIAGYLGAGLRRRVLDRPHPRPAAQRRRRARQHKGKPWARLGVDVDNGFEPLYIVTPTRSSQVTQAQGAAEGRDELYLATDEDREGEAIAWHLLETLKPTVPVSRMVFHEITPQAIRARRRRPPRARPRGSSTPRRPGASSTGSTATRSARCCGRRSCRGCRPGRVQCVATRVLVERERERMRVPRRRLLGPRGQLRTAATRRPDRAAHADRHARRARRPPARHRPRLRHRRAGSSRRRRACALDEAGARGARRRPRAAPLHRPPGRGRSPTAARRTRRS